MNILITGGSSGLGKETVKLLASNKDDKIYFTFRNKESESKMLQDSFVNVKGIKVDFRDKENLSKFLKILPELDIDILINNAYAGDPQGTYIHKTPIKDYETAIMTNIIPTIMITQSCLEGMRKRKFGKIIYILTSYLIDVPPIGFSVYASIKAFLRQFSKSITKEYGRFYITSNCIFPDFMNTDFSKVEDFQLEQLKSNHPLKKILTPKEVAQTIEYIVRSSQQLNGGEIVINAGQHIL